MFHGKNFPNYKKRLLWEILLNFFQRESSGIYANKKLLTLMKTIYHKSDSDYLRYCVACRKNSFIVKKAVGLTLCAKLCLFNLVCGALRDLVPFAQF